VIVFLGIIWVLILWPFVVVLNVIGLTLQPIVYVPLYGCTWLEYSFLNKEDDILPDYWKGYPEEYINNMKTGFPLLKRWLLDRPNEFGTGDDPILFACAAFITYLGWFVLTCCGFSSCLGMLGIQ
jgi:hypothetical protein